MPAPVNHYDFTPGTASLLVSMPQCGNHIPPHPAADATLADCVRPAR